MKRSGIRPVRSGSGAENHTPGLRINRAFLFPRLAALVAGFDDFEFVILDVFTPRQAEALLIELLQQRNVTFPRRRLRPQVEFGQLPPAHRAQGVPVEADVFLRCFWILGDEGTGGIEFTTGALAVVEVVVARFAAHRGGAPNLVEIPLAGFIPGRFAPLDAFPLERLTMAAFGTGERPFALVGGVELAVGVVVFLAALAHEDALAEPAEGGDASLSFRHVTLGASATFRHRSTSGSNGAAGWSCCAPRESRASCRW